MSDYQPAIIKHVMTQKCIDERRHTLFEFRRFTVRAVATIQPDRA